jgi:hypothetical protein
MCAHAGYADVPSNVQAPVSSEGSEILPQELVFYASLLQLHEAKTHLTHSQNLYMMWSHVLWRRSGFVGINLFKISRYSTSLQDPFTAPSLRYVSQLSLASIRTVIPLNLLVTHQLYNHVQTFISKTRFADTTRRVRAPAQPSNMCDYDWW